MSSPDDPFADVRDLAGLGQLAGGVAHEFNNLLAIIRGCTEIVLEDLEIDHPSRCELDEILESVGRGARLTRRLLAFGQRQIVRRRAFDLNTALAVIEPELIDLTSDCVTLQSCLDNELPLVLADPVLVERALRYLVENAVDAMPLGGRLRLRTRAHRVTSPIAVTVGELVPGEYVCIVLTDDGVGVPASVGGRIFQPFFSTKRSASRFGLGLPAVCGITSQHGGGLDFESRPGEGTTVTLYLPAASAADRPGHSERGGGLGSAWKPALGRGSRAGVRLVLLSNGTDAKPANDPPESDLD